MGISSEDITALVEPALSSSGLHLWDIEITRDTLRIFIDADGGIDLDSLSSAARGVIAPILDAHPDLTPDGSFHLEVSSPGIERKLRRPEHFDRYVGTEIALKTRLEISGSRRHRGILVAAGSDGVRLEAGSPPVEMLFEYDDIDWARTVASWNTTTKPHSTVSTEAKETAQ